MSASKTFDFRVSMTCEACVNAVKRSLTKTYGAELVNVDVDLGKQLVQVTLSNPEYTYDQVEQAVAKCGKAVTRV